MKADHAKHPTERMELPGILSEFRQALNDEIDEIEKSGQSSTLLFGGQRLEGHAPEYWYRFQVEYAPSIPADTPCKLIIGNNQFEVTTVSFEENYIIISSNTNILLKRLIIYRFCCIMVMVMKNEKIHFYA